MVMPSGSELDVVTRNLTGVYTLSISDQVLTSLVQKSEYRKKLSRNHLLQVSTDGLNVMRYQILQYLSVFERDPSLRSDRVFIDEMEHEILWNLLKLVDCGETIHKNRRHWNKTLQWKRIETFLEENEKKPVRVSDMSLITGISDRTLLRLFQDRFHVSPKAYLNRLRLNGTHQELRRADTMKGRISDIANRWGFWHMGQFAADYKCLFGELPSDTVKRNREIKNMY